MTESIDTITRTGIEYDAEACAGDVAMFAPWVELRTETCRRDRLLVTAVNQRTGHAIRCTPDELVAARTGRCAVGGESADVINELRTGGYLAGSPDPGPAVTDNRQRGDGLVWPGADRFVTRAHDRFLHRLFTGRWIAAQVGLGVLGAVLFATVVLASPLQLRATPAQIPLIIALGLVVVAIHELGHAVVTVHFGRRVRMVGLRLHLGSPAFYVDSVDALLLSRRQRLIQVAAGPWAEWLATTVAMLALVVVPADGAAAFVLHRFVIVNTIGIAINLLPFVGLDGSLLLSDAIREPDLAARARDAVTGAGPREGGLVAYALANSAVAGILVVSAAFFWWELFGGLVTAVWTSGPAGGAAVVVGAVLMVRRTATTAVLSMFPAAGCVRSRLLFRLERRWRVRAIKALARMAPDLARLDAGALGILAGRLTCVERGVPVGDGELVVDAGRRRVILAGDWPMFLVTA